MAGKQRPRVWAPLDLWYTQQDTIGILGDEFGSDGPMVFLGLILLAHRQVLERALNGRPQGTVEARWGTLAGEVRTVGPERCRAVLRACEALGLIALDERGERFHARLLKWGAWEVADLLAAGRKRQSRSGDIPL